MTTGTAHSRSTGQPRRSAGGLGLGSWFLVWMLAVTVLILTLSVAMVTWHLEGQLHRGLEARGREAARLLARTTAEPSLGPPALVGVPECVAAVVETTGGERLWSFGPTLQEALQLEPSLVRVEETVRSGARSGDTVRATVLLSTAQVRANVLGTGARLVVALGLGLGLALVAGVLLLNGVVEPLRRLAEAVRSYRPEDIVELPPAGGGGREVRELTEAFRQMSDRLSIQRLVLRRSEHRYRGLFAAAPAPLLEADVDLALRAVNPAAEPFVGSQPAGMDLRDFLVDAAGVELPLPTGGRERTRTEARWRLPDGAEAEVELDLQRVEGIGDDTILVALHDLTDRLRQLGERWRRTFDEMSEGVGLVDAAGGVTLANRALEPHVRHLERELVRRAGDGGRAEWQTEHGERMLQCVLTAASEAPERILVVRDITDWKRAEARLREAQKMEAVATLAGGVAHDFNNLLAGILLHLRLLEQDPGAADEAVRAIRALAEEGADVVRGLLLFARAETSPRRPLDLAAAVAEQEPLLHHLLPAHLELEVRLPAEPAPVLASPTELRRLLLNLVVNARQAVGDQPGKVQVEVRRTADRVELEVQDSGPGIPEAWRERVFEPFFSTRREGRGAGIGLAVVYAIVVEHDGAVQVGDGATGGARITVRLPLRSDLEQEIPEPEPRPPRDSGPTGRGERILVVEDEAAIRGRLESELTMAGYAVWSASSVAAARRRCERTAPQGLVVDLVLPDGHGADLVRELREALGPLPSVLITGNAADQEEAVAGLDAAVVEKPFRVEDLLVELRRQLDRDGRHTTGGPPEGTG